MKEAIDLCELMQQYGDEQSCRNYLEHLRWPHGVECPKCKGKKISSILKRDLLRSEHLEYKQLVADAA